MCTFAEENIKKRIMTALQLNAELFRELSIIAEDESLMQKAVKYLKKLTAKKQAMDETEYIMSSPAMVEILKQGEEDIKNGNFKVVTLDEIWK
jgi:hypothetical protein